MVRKWRIVMSSFDMLKEKKYQGNKLRCMAIFALLAFFLNGCANTSEVLKQSGLFTQKPLDNDLKWTDARLDAGAEPISDTADGLVIYVYPRKGDVKRGRYYEIPVR